MAESVVNPPPKVCVQQAIFDPALLLRDFLDQTQTSGAVCQFIGLVRDYRKTQDTHIPLRAMRLDHYPGMTEKVLLDLVVEAEARFTLERTALVHRFGMLLPNEPIVMVLAASSHRADVFAACEFLMDRLKTDAPFWKCEFTKDGQTLWVDAQVEDDHRTQRWLKKS